MANCIIPVTIYTAPCGISKSEAELHKILDKASSEFSRRFDAGFSYDYRPCEITPFDTYAISLIEKTIDSEIAERLSDRAQETLGRIVKTLVKYQRFSVADRIIYDFYRYVANENGTPTPKGLHCLMQKDSIYHDNVVTRAHAYTDENILVVSTDGPDSHVRKWFLHEVAHCMGARHSDAYLSIMNPSSARRSIWLWDRKTRAAVGKGIEGFCDGTR